MRTLSIVVVAILVVFAGALPLAAQWMGGPGSHSGWWGGGMCRMMDVTSRPVNPASLPEPKSLGAQVLQNQCTQCHGLVAPGQESARDWPAIVDRMDRRMQMMSHGRMGMMRHSIQPLTPAERQALLDYLQRYAFHAVQPETLPQGKTSAAQAYINGCSRCHALPDPAAHSSGEWPGVVKRMEANMANMGMTPYPPQQEKEILAYLQERASK